MTREALNRTGFERRYLSWQGLKKVGDLQINENMEFQRRSWIVQRVGWAIFSLMILLALLGLFGDGPLSDKQAGQKERALWLEFPRFERFQDEFRIKVHVDEGTAMDGEIMIRLDRNYLENIEVNSISPAPDNEIKDEDWITYLFRNNGGSSPFTAYFDVTPRKAGALSGSFQLQNGDAVGFPNSFTPNRETMICWR